MSKVYGSVNPSEQREHLPPAQNWLSENNPVYFILDTVTELDISTITATYEQRQRGFPPGSPRMMVALLLYSYFRGVFSSRKIMQACQEQLAFRAIVGDNIPDWRTIRDFRKLHIKELEGLFIQVLKQCQRTGLTKLGYVGWDRRKVKAEAGRQKGMNCCRMKEEERRLRYMIQRLLSEAEAVDQQEDQPYSTGCRGEKSPEQFVHQQSHLELIGRAKGALETETKDSVKQARAARSGKWPNQGRRRTVILDTSVDNEIRPPTWEEAARKCMKVYEEVISEHKNHRRR